MRRLLLSVAALVAATAAQATEYRVTVQPQGEAKGYEKLTISKAALGSAPIRLWANTVLEPDCSPHQPGPTLTVLEPPAHGAATISDEPFYPGYPAGNPRSACNTRKVPGHQAFYTAAAGYTGHDRTVLQGSSPDGHIRRITVDIDVR